MDVFRNNQIGERFCCERLKELLMITWYAADRSIGRIATIWLV